MIRMISALVSSITFSSSAALSVISLIAYFSASIASVVSTAATAAFTPFTACSFPLLTLSLFKMSIEAERSLIGYRYGSSSVVTCLVGYNDCINSVLIPVQHNIRTCDLTVQRNVCNVLLCNGNLLRNVVGLAFLNNANYRKPFMS